MKRQANPESGTAFGGIRHAPGREKKECYEEYKSVWKKMVDYQNAKTERGY